MVYTIWYKYKINKYSTVIYTFVHVTSNWNIKIFKTTKDDAHLQIRCG